jgi:hypothetical protein
MTSSTDTRTAPADIATRVHELELVLQAVVAKLATLAPPDDGGDPGDLTDLWDAIKRLQKISLRGAHTGATEPDDVLTETIFDGDDLGTSGSAFAATYGDDYDSKSLIADMGKGLAKPFYRQVFELDSPFPTIGRSLSLMTYGYDGDTNFDGTLNDAGKSLCEGAFGSPTKFTTMLARSAAKGKSLYDMITKLETRMDAAEDDIADLQDAIG